MILYIWSTRLFLVLLVYFSSSSKCSSDNSVFASRRAKQNETPLAIPSLHPPFNPCHPRNKSPNILQASYELSPSLDRDQCCRVFRQLWGTYVDIPLLPPSQTFFISGWRLVRGEREPRWGLRMEVPGCLRLLLRGFWRWLLGGRDRGRMGFWGRNWIGQDSMMN